MSGTTGKAPLRILYITNDFPFPLTSGILRHYFLIKELSQRHRITLLSIVRPDLEPESRAALAPFTDDIHTFATGEHSRSRARRLSVRARLLLPGSGARTPAGRLAATAARLIAADGFDAVLLSGKRTFPALARLDGLPVVIDMCDTASDRVRGNLRLAPARRIPHLLLEYLEMRRAERILAANGTHLLFASPRDRDVLQERHPDVGRRVPASVLPNGVDLDYWRRAATTLGKTEVVLTGAMDWPPNEDAALHLIHDIMPGVWRSLPETRLSIVGRSAPPALRSAAADPRVTVTGYVADVRPYLERAAVFAAPLRFAAGIQNKVLEAMAMEMPAVVTPLVAAGLHTADGRVPPLAVASSADEFAARLVERLVAVAGDGAPETAARRFVEENFTWRRSAELLEQVLETVSRASSPAAREE